MRKIRCIICVSILFLVVVLCSCSSKIDEYDKVISEIRANHYVGSINDNSVYAVTGEREKDYKVDGVSGERVDFFILTVEGVYSAIPKCEIILDGVEHKGVMQKHPFADSYSFEIAQKIDSNEVTVCLEIGNEKSEIMLVSVLSSESKTTDFAFEVAKKELDESIKNHLKNGVFDGEVYIRIIPNPTQDDGKYFWYVAFYKNASECYCALVDCESGEVVATKKE